MVENVQRKITLIAALLIVAALCLIVPEQPFRLGLDLQGGTRLLYRFDFEKAVADGTIDERELQNKPLLLQEFINITRNRLDKTGTLDLSIRPQGEDRVVIELPGTALASANAQGKLKAPLAANAKFLVLQDMAPAEIEAFPSTGGVISIGAERIAYGSRTDTQLNDLERGFSATSPAEHVVEANVRLVSSDAILNAIENTGQLRFYLGASVADPFFTQNGTDYQTQLSQVTAWIAANPSTPISEYNSLSQADGGAPERLKWFPHHVKSSESFTPIETRLAPLLIPTKPEENFSGDDLKTTGVSVDNVGLPAVSFQMADDRALDFGNFTENHKNELMGIVLNDEIVTLATINERLNGGGIINGGARGFKIAEVNEMVTLLRSGSLKIKPILEERERVGATLGHDNVYAGFISIIIGLAAVLVFIAIYYRKLGLFAAVSLLFNLVLLMGAMAFMQATLTLPGIAGIILTVGMAVDANILIYERMREETKRGAKILLAAKNGFDKALSTIIDANLTTFITAAVLFKIGSGPVRGFATTLMIGIVTSVFAALVLTRLLVHISIEGGTKKFSMSEFVGDTKIAFMKKAKGAIAVSLILIVAGVGYFISLPDNVKLSIDFLGGFTVTARTEAPQTKATIEQGINTIEGQVARATVAPILSSAAGDDKYTMFRITYKSSGADSEEATGGESIAKTGETEIRHALASILQKGPIDLTIAQETGGRRANGALYFEEVHSPAEISAVMAGTGLTDIQVQTVRESEAVSVYSFTAGATADKTATVLVPLIDGLFHNLKDGTGTDYVLANPIPESSIIGASVVGQLRDSALLAILVSLFFVVLYIRARFAEYSYGFAAVAALTHDVLMTLGVLAVTLTLFPALEVEISLPMVAAFLTIIGYSLNDTIVVFDRIRENMPRMKMSLSEVIDASINQTLSRTLLTSVTTLLTVVILLAFNVTRGGVLAGFAFALTFGVVVGTYSSIFIACPVFLWLEQRARDKADGAPAVDSKETNKALEEAEAAVGS